MTTSPHEDPAAEQLSRLTLRLPAAEHAQLREAAYRSRTPVAVLARALLLRVLSDGELPPPAPPATGELGPRAQELLSICHALTSNFTQLDSHAANSGEPIARLAGDGNLLQQLRAKSRELGLEIKRGELNEDRCSQALDAIKPASVSINALTRALNENRAAVNPGVWHGPLTAIRSALEIS